MLSQPSRSSTAQRKRSGPAYRMLGMHRPQHPSREQVSQFPRLPQQVRSRREGHSIQENETTPPGMGKQEGRDRQRKQPPQERGTSNVNEGRRHNGMENPGIHLASRSGTGGGRGGHDGLRRISKEPQANVQRMVEEMARNTGGPNQHRTGVLRTGRNGRAQPTASSVPLHSVGVPGHAHQVHPAGDIHHTPTRQRTNRTNTWERETQGSGGLLRGCKHWTSGIPQGHGRDIPRTRRVVQDDARIWRKRRNHRRSGGIGSSVEAHAHRGIPHAVPIQRGAMQPDLRAQ